jgi:hypothetical protein
MFFRLVRLIPVGALSVVDCNQPPGESSSVRLWHGVELCAELRQRPVKSCLQLTGRNDDSLLSQPLVKRLQGFVIHSTMIIDESTGSGGSAGVRFFRAAPRTGKQTERLHHDAGSRPQSQSSDDAWTPWTPRVRPNAPSSVSGCPAMHCSCSSNLAGVERGSFRFASRG